MALFLAFFSLIGAPPAWATGDYEERVSCRLPGTGSPEPLGLADTVCRLQPVSAQDADMVNCCSGPTRPGANGFHFSARQDCDAAKLAEAAAFRPDSLVVLGAGHLPGGAGSCNAVQRVHSSFQFFEAMRSRAPAPEFARFKVVLTGRHPTPAEPLEEPDRVCLQERLTRTIARMAPGYWQLPQLRAQLASARVPENPQSITEADQMCGLFLRHYPTAQRAEVLAHLEFEPEAVDTVDNVRRAIPILRRIGSRRPLLVTTNDPRSSNPLNWHSNTSLSAFRREAAVPTSGTAPHGPTGEPPYTGHPASIACPYSD